MTYQESENSVRSAAPIELYKFEGTYENYYYTTAARKIKYGGKDYLPIPMQRTEISAGTENDDGLDISVEIPVTQPIIAVYGFEAAPPKLDLTIYRYHNQNEVVRYWVGPVAQITTNGGIGTVRSTSELASVLSQDFPNVYYQGPCNNVLFDRRCKVIEADYSGEAVLAVFNGKALSVDAIPAGASGKALDGLLIGGEVLLSSGERRMIVAQAGVVITVNFPFSRIAVGDTITITAGCDHGYESDCKLKFDNQKNFGGFPFITGDNKFTDGVDDGSTLPDATCLPAHFSGWYWRLALHVHGKSSRVPPYVPAMNTPQGDPFTWTRDIDGANRYFAWLSNKDFPDETQIPTVWQFGPASDSQLGTTCEEHYSDGNCLVTMELQYWEWAAPKIVETHGHYTLFDYGYTFTLTK
jgi:uncharacterized phage protein (TIGR02218 family)